MEFQKRAKRVRPMGADADSYFRGDRLRQEAKRGLKLRHDPPELRDQGEGGEAFDS